MESEASQKYLSQQVMSASPAKLVAMLYDRAIALLNDAVEAIEVGDTQRRWKSNSKATEIIGELWRALDLENGNEIAENLNRLYGFMIMRLTMVDVENNAQAARDVIRLLEPIRRSWHELAEGQTAEPRPNANRGTTTEVSLSA